eukprot:TRINITY_DN929_c0_g2_i24.p1 TRINITY_DN929_c0_g2~~TRINITY_DN929_c0_g2_i24.p1  ORF type:complete len:426 (+),score=83.73 TRINITY_DN929_c0_g2_i24:1129-2406(+)
MMEIISGKKWTPPEIDQVIRMLDHDRDGVISYDDFRAKIWNLRWFIEPAKTVQPIKSVTSLTGLSPECVPFWGRHWSTTGCGEGAQYFLSKTFQWIENPERLKVQGVYRLPGQASAVEVMRHTLIGVPGSILKILGPDQDVCNVANLVKLYFKEMPEPLFPHDLYTECTNAIRVDKKEQKERVIFVVNHLPEPNRRVLKILMRHLNKVCAYSVKNLMTSKNMAIVFGPTLLRPLVETPETSNGTTDAVVDFVQLIIDKPGKILADENMNGFVPSFTVNPHLPQEPSPQPAVNESKTLTRKKVVKSPSNVGQKRVTNTSPKDRSSSVLQPIALTFQAFPDEKSELQKLFDHMQTESKAATHSKAFLSYKEVILNIKLAVRCARCGKISAEVDPNFCSTCGFNLKGGHENLPETGSAVDESMLSQII